MIPQPPSWLLLVLSLPSDSATARVRIWRALKALGCGALRDGAYLLPQLPQPRQALAALADETLREGGSAWLLTVQAQDAEEQAAYQALFDRGDAYRDWRAEVAEQRAGLAQLAPAAITRLLRKLRRDLDALRAIDYFPNAASAQAQTAWSDFVAAADSLLSPGEPHAAHAGIARLDRADYQGRRWATRRRLWVDRAASAWLIGRFIDHSARFLWLDTPADCPADALGFDFDGAAFTHVGDKVSFEVLLASFGLDADRALARLGALVHTLDVGDGFVPEASGVEAVMAGARQRSGGDDDRMLAEAGAVFDALYAHFSADPSAAT